MEIPDWMSEVLSQFDGKTESHSETEIAEALGRARSSRGDLPEDEWKVFLAEHSVFFLRPSRKPEQGFWGTYFAPMAILTGKDGKDVTSPDITQLDAESVTHWESRAETVTDPVMKARYADASWDLAKRVAGTKPNHNMARIASDAYVLATERGLSTIPPFAVQWLVRALDLARSVRDDQRTSEAAEAMVRFYKANLSPKLVGIWITIFDELYASQNLLTRELIKSMILDLESMLKRLTTIDEHNEFDPFNAQAVGERLIRHYRSVGDADSVARVVKTFGGAFEQQANGAGAMLATAWLQPIAERYEQEGLKAEAEALQNKLEKRYAEITNELKTYSLPIRFTQEQVDELFRYLIVDKDLASTLKNIGTYFIPKVGEARKLIQSKGSVAPLLSLMPIELLDSSGRPKAHIGSTEDDAEGHLYYQLTQIMTFSDPFLYLVLERVREQFAPSAEDLTSFLYECPVFVESRKGILQQGLAAYLEHDFVKSIHILVPQLEEVLRNLLAMIGVPTVKNVPRHPGITDVKSMNNVLEEERIREILPEDVWRYLTLLYIDRRGVNLRNDLAHGLIVLEGFNEYSSNRVLHSLLALTPITIKPRRMS